MILRTLVFSLLTLCLTVGCLVAPAQAQRPRADLIQPLSQTPAAQQQMRDRQNLLDRDRIQRDLVARDGPRDRRGRRLTPSQITEAAQAAATAAGLTCEVKDALLLGSTDSNEDLYEVACEGGAGFILTSASPPQTFDCLALMAQAERALSEGRETGPHSVCALPGNQDAAALVAGYARDAGVACRVDAGKALGLTAEGRQVYEVGCAQAVGYHLEKTAEGWKSTDCLEIAGMNLSCDFTTVDERVASVRPLLSGTAIDDCDAQDVRLLAQNDTGRFIEIKCATGEGFVARVRDNAINQVYPCRLAVRIGGGCTLTAATGVTRTPASND